MKYTICAHAVDFYTYKNAVRTDVVSFAYKAKQKHVEFRVGHCSGDALECDLEEAKSMLPEVARKILGLNCVVKVK